MGDERVTTFVCAAGHDAPWSEERVKVTRYLKGIVIASVVWCNRCWEKADR